MTEKTVSYAVVIASLLILSLSVYALRRMRRRKLGCVPAGMSILALIVGGYAFWYVSRPLPDNADVMLFEGIEYIREVRPGPIIVHVVKVNLDAPGIKFFVTPLTPTEGWELSGRITSQFLADFGLQMAINGDFFDPWRDVGFWDYYPHVGDGVNVRGLTASDGDIYTDGYTARENYATLYIAENNQMSFNQPSDNIYNAISGNMMLVENGVALPIKDDNDYLAQRHPRTAVALDETGHIFIIFIVDGRQPNYSEGVTIPELNDIILSYGGYNALNLDGGGSVTLAVEGENGEPLVLNSPIHNHIPGRERPVANHLGIYAERLAQDQ